MRSRPLPDQGRDVSLDIDLDAPPRIAPQIPRPAPAPADRVAAAVARGEPTRIVVVGVDVPLIDLIGLLLKGALASLVVGALLAVPAAILYSLLRAALH